MPEESICPDCSGTGKWPESSYVHSKGSNDCLYEPFMPNLNNYETTMRMMQLSATCLAVLVFRHGDLP
jgi:hypothetical protein